MELNYFIEHDKFIDICLKSLICLYLMLVQWLHSKRFLFLLYLAHNYHKVSVSFFIEEEAHSNKYLPNTVVKIMLITCYA